MIKLEDVHKTFRTGRGEVRALDGVSLSVERGEFLAIEGRSGSGKSTLLSLVGGLALPTSGLVSVDGLDLRAMSAADRAAFRNEKIGFVFQLFHLLPYLNVVDNVLLAAPNTAKRETLRSAAEALLNRFELDERLWHRPAQLSAGERQRVAMARALLNRPSLLVADEPTGNLDSENTAVLLDLVEDFHREGGTVLLATHDQIAAERAGRRVALSHGQLA